MSQGAWQESLRQRIKVAQKFGLDLTNEEVLDLLIPPPIANSSDELPSLSAYTLPPEKILFSIADNTVTNQQPEKPIKIYGENWIVLQNRLLNAISPLDLNERRVIMFLSPLVRKVIETNPNERTFVLKVQDFLEEYNIRSKRYYEELSNSCSSLVNKAYIFWDFNKNQKRKTKTEVSWLTKAEYQDNLGEVHVDLHPDVIEMLTVFDKANPFTKYERRMIVNLGGYGIILFELISSCMHQQHKQKSYTIEYLREKFNCIDTYLTATDFKRYVLDNAIKDIEKHTPYRITYKQNKKGRVVYEIVFSFVNVDEKALQVENKKITKQKKDIAQNTADNGDSFIIEGLSDKQLARVVHSKKFMADYNEIVSPNNPANQSSNNWISHMMEWIKKDPQRFNKRSIQEYLDDEQANRF